MLNRLLLEFYKSPNNGKQVAALPDGRRLLLIHSEIMGPATLELKIARDQQPTRFANSSELASGMVRDS